MTSCVQQFLGYAQEHEYVCENHYNQFFWDNFKHWAEEEQKKGDDIVNDDVFIPAALITCVQHTCRIAPVTVTEGEVRYCYIMNSTDLWEKFLARLEDAKACYVAERFRQMVMDGTPINEFTLQRLNGNIGAIKAYVAGDMGAFISHLVDVLADTPAPTRLIKYWLGGAIGFSFDQDFGSLAR